MNSNNILFLKGLNELRAIAALAVLVHHRFISHFGNVFWGHLFLMKYRMMLKRN